MYGFHYKQEKGIELKCKEPILETKIYYLQFLHSNHHDNQIFL